ncbi:hypothetical protein NFI96_032415 [Prochilodus magdalenae]|nr:hypothetical protein NFI96_032415 [Prochilodus magdalenae]
MERLLSMPYCAMEEEFVQRFRRQLEVQSSKQEIPALQHDENGVAFSQADGRRKTAKASVTLRDCGSGGITINGKSYLQYFPILQDRKQLMFPLHFVDMLGRYDVEATVEGGGHSAQSGALRLAISRALLSFVSAGEMESMRQGGLLTPDPRVKERKKPGQAGARKKFTWKRKKRMSGKGPSGRVTRDRKLVILFFFLTTVPPHMDLFGRLHKTNEELITEDDPLALFCLARR